MLLAIYLETAALSWMNLPNCETQPKICQQFERQEHETVEQVRDRIHEVAGQVVAVVEDPAEVSIWSNDPTHRRAGLLLMHLAFQESRFRGYVDDGRCNDVAWWKTKEAGLLLRLGTCDNKRAYGLWQDHAKENPMWLVFDSREFVGYRKGHVENGIKLDEETIRDRTVAIRTALHILRKSIKATGTIRWYTSEWSGPCPKATLRLEGAIAYEKKNPN